MRAVAFVFALLVCTTAQGSDFERELTAAYHASDTEKLEKLRENQPSGYLSAYLDWRLGSVLFGRGEVDAADAVWQRAQSTLEKLVAREPDSGEAWALYSSTLGMRIGVRPGTRGMKMGAASGKAGKRALKLEPGNPRVLLIIGVNKYNTPLLFGGGVKKAIRYLNKSLESWESGGSGSYDWGQTDTYVWRGQAYLRAGKEAAACIDFARALEIAPGFRWAQDLWAQSGCEE